MSGDLQRAKKNRPVTPAMGIFLVGTAMAIVAGCGESQRQAGRHAPGAGDGPGAGAGEDAGGDGGGSTGGRGGTAGVAGEGASATGGQSGMGGTTNVAGAGVAGSGVVAGSGGSGGMPVTPGCESAVPHNGVLDVQRQSQLDALPLYSEIIGDFYAYSEVTSLARLACVRRITGEVRIKLTTGLTSFAGLQQVESVQTLVVEDNRGLESFDGFESLSSVTNIHIKGNPALESVSALQRVKSVNRMTIEVNAALESLVGLEGLETVLALLVKGNSSLESADLERLVEIDELVLESNPRLINFGAHGVVNAGSVRIIDNYALTSLGLDELTSVGTLTIQNNDALPGLNGLAKLERADEITIGTNFSLSDLDGLSSLRTVTGYFSVYENESITSVAGLGGVTTVYALDITANESLEEIAGLESMAIADVLSIRDNHPVSARLGDFAGVKNVRTVVINGPFTDLEGLSHLESVDEMEVYAPITALGWLQNASVVSLRLGNTRLTTLEDLEGVMTPTGGIFLVENALLNSLSGLAAGMTGFGTISISGSPELVNLAGLEELTSLFSLDVSLNESLASLTGLENLRTVNSLFVHGNANLTSLSALASLMRVDGYFQVTDNPRLPTCEVYALHDVTGGEPTVVYGNQDPKNCP